MREFSAMCLWSSFWKWIRNWSVSWGELDTVTRTFYCVGFHLCQGFSVFTLLCLQMARVWRLQQARDETTFIQQTWVFISFPPHANDKHVFSFLETFFLAHLMHISSSLIVSIPFEKHLWSRVQEVDALPEHSQPM